MELKPSLSKVPEHLGIILDGNRRFSKRLMLKPWKGHEWGAKKVETFLEWCKEYKIKEVTLFAFSLENFDRPKMEFDFLMKLFESEFRRMLKDERLEKDKVRVSFIGRIEMFPKSLQDVMKKLMNKTAKNNNFIVNFAMAYGGRAEIIDATKKIAKQVSEGNLNIDQINNQVFQKNLYIESEPDLIIRTSESRTSGFLSWQSDYAEIIFLPNKLWPEFEKEDFVECLNEYSNRQRRFGK